MDIFGITSSNFDDYNDQLEKGTQLCIPSTTFPSLQQVFYFSKHNMSIKKLQNKPQCHSLIVVSL
jgi:hypothetical protein